MVVVVAISLGPAIPMHPVNPGSEVSPPAGNETSPAPSPTTTNQGITHTVTLYHLHPITMPKPA
jgi:hypothetical protein